MDKMIVVGKDGKPRYLVTDKVMTLCHEPCPCERPIPTTVRIDTKSVDFCENCGCRINTDLTSQEKK